MPDRLMMAGLLLRFAPHLGLAALLALVAATAAVALQTARLDKTRAALAAQTAAHATEIAVYRAAQAQADADWQAHVTRLTTNNRRLKDDADRATDTVRTLYRDRVLRLPAAATTGRPAPTSGLSAARLAQSPDRPGNDPVLLTREDTLICAENSARLQAVHDWASAQMAVTSH